MTSHLIRSLEEGGKYISLRENSAHVYLGMDIPRKATRVIAMSLCLPGFLVFIVPDALTHPRKKRKRKKARAV